MDRFAGETVLIKVSKGTGLIAMNNTNEEHLDYLVEAFKADSDFLKKTENLHVLYLLAEV